MLSPVGLGARYQTPGPPGAGRSRDFVWPDQALSGQSPAANLFSRIRATTVGSLISATTVGFGGGTSIVSDVRNGIGTAKLTSTVGGAGVGIRFQEAAIRFCTQRNNIIDGTSPAAWNRIVVVMAADAPPGNGNDLGFSACVNSGSGSLIVDTLNGFEIQLFSANSVRFLTRSVASGLVATTITGIDITAWNTFDLVMGGAGLNFDGIVQLTINGIPQVLPASQSSWKAGTTVLPQNEFSVGWPGGWVPGMINRASGQTVWCALLHMICGPTLLSLY